GRNQEALRLLNAAYRRFRRLDARVDLVHVGGKMAELEATFLAVVREWGQSLESSDRSTFGHCERVAKNAVAMARILGLEDEQETTLLIGAYLHDLGKVRVPHEILTKPGLPVSRSLCSVTPPRPSPCPASRYSPLPSPFCFPRLLQLKAAGDRHGRRGSPRRRPRRRRSSTPRRTASSATVTSVPWATASRRSRAWWA